MSHLHSPSKALPIYSFVEQQSDAHEPDHDPMEPKNTTKQNQFKKQQITKINDLLTK